MLDRSDQRDRAAPVVRKVNDYDLLDAPSHGDRPLLHAVTAVCNLDDHRKRVVIFCGLRQIVRPRGRLTTD